MQNLKEVRDLFVHTDGENNWQVDWWEEDEDGIETLRFIQEICSPINCSDYKRVCDVVKQEFGVDMPNKSELKKMVDECWEGKSKAYKRKHRRHPYVEIYFIKDFKKI